MQNLFKSRIIDNAIPKRGRSTVNLLDDRKQKNLKKQRVKKDESIKIADKTIIQPQPKVFITKPIFKSSILVWINTFERVDSLRELLQDIENNKDEFDVKVFIVDDGSKSDYISLFKEFSHSLDIEYHKMAFNHGKHKYWKLCNYALQVIKTKFNQYKYYVKVDDDCRLMKDFFKRCVNIWENISDRNKICLNFRLDSREGKRVWTGVLPKRIIFNSIPLYLSQWVDMDFFCTIKMLKALNFKITEQPIDRWLRNQNNSSGVGRDISLRLFYKHLNLYLTTETLVIHNHHGSKMNPHERGINPLMTKQTKDNKYGYPKE
jgi:hypothetical protein